MREKLLLRVIKRVILILSISLFILGLSPSKLNAQDKKIITKFCIIKNYKEHREFFIDTSLHSPKKTISLDNKFDEEFNSDRFYLIKSQIETRESDKKTRMNHYLLICFYNSDNTPKTDVINSIKEIKFEPKQSSYSASIKPADSAVSSYFIPDQNYILLPLQKYFENQEFVNNRIVTIKVEYTNDSKINEDINYFKIGKNLTWYSDGYHWTNGLWFPFGLFGVHKEDDVGFVFSPQPLNVAYGFRWFVSDSFYLGFSGLLGWVIYNYTEEDNNEETKGSFAISQFSFGFLGDINDFLFIGWVKTLDFTTNKKNSQLLIGATARLDTLFRK